MDFELKLYFSLIAVMFCFCEYLLAETAACNPIGGRYCWFDLRLRWSYGMIPYVISSEYSYAERQIILNAMKEWESKTCIQFVPWQPADASYVEITPVDGTYSYCYSPVGRQGGRQIMKMFGECMKNAAMVHELGHVIGFNHEHQRPDREKFIKIHSENINPNFRYAFDCFTCKGVYSIGTYDFASVMHYPFFAFTELYDETRPSMTLKDGSISTIYRAAEYLSDADVYKTKLYYQNCLVA